MKNYEWISIKQSSDTPEKTIAFIATSSGFFGDTQKIIKQEIRLLAEQGFEVKVPVFVTEGEECPQELILDNEENKEQFENIPNLVIEPMDREQGDMLAVSPKTGADQIIDCIQNEWNMLPLRGGNGFQDKIPLIVGHFTANSTEKKPNVAIYGYSNCSLANVLMLEGICSYVPTPYANFLIRLEMAEKKENKDNPYFQYFKDHTPKFISFLKGEKPLETFTREVLFYPEDLKNQKGTTMHYPFNLDLLTAIYKDGTDVSFKLKEGEKWSFGIEWMMQMGANNAIFANTPELINKFLEDNKENLPQFIEIGGLTTRFDGFNGVADLICDEKGYHCVDDRNVARISQQKENFVKCLNSFLTDYKNLTADNPNKAKHRTLPEFFLKKLWNSDAITADEIDNSKITAILKWQNEVAETVRNEVVEIAKQYNVPLVLNTRFGHVANMSPIESGSCQYSISKEGLKLSTTDKNNQQQPDTSTTASSTNPLKDTTNQKGQNE